MRHVSNLHKTLTFLDISFCSEVTDAGLQHFEGKTSQLVMLSVNGLPKISSVGLNHVVAGCTETLVEFEAALMDQIEMKGEFFPSLARCYNLEYIDLTGTKNIDDMAISALSKYEIVSGEGPNAVRTRPGLPYLHTLRLNGINIGDFGVSEMIKASKAIEHIELAGCVTLTEAGVNKLLSDCEGLRFLDINSIPSITYPFLDDIMQRKPDLLVKRHKHQDYDFKKDNGLRLPRLIIGAKKKKGKKKKGKKKK